MTQEYYWFSPSSKSHNLEQVTKPTADGHDKAGRPAYVDYVDPTGSFFAIYVGPVAEVTVGKEQKTFNPGQVLEYTAHSPHVEARPVHNPDDVQDVAVLDPRHVARVQVPSGRLDWHYTIGDGGADNRQLTSEQRDIVEAVCNKPDSKLKAPVIEGPRMNRSSNPAGPAVA